MLLSPCHYQRGDILIGLIWSPAVSFNQTPFPQTKKRNEPVLKKGKDKRGLVQVGKANAITFQGEGLISIRLGS